MNQKSMIHDTLPIQGPLSLVPPHSFTQTHFMLLTLLSSPLCSFHLQILQAIFVWCGTPPLDVNPSPWPGNHFVDGVKPPVLFVCASFLYLFPQLHSSVPIDILAKG